MTPDEINKIIQQSVKAVRFWAVYGAEISRRVGMRRTGWRDAGREEWWDATVADALAISDASEDALERLGRVH